MPTKRSSIRATVTPQDLPGGMWSTEPSSLAGMVIIELAALCVSICLVPRTRHMACGSILPKGFPKGQGWSQPRVRTRIPANVA
jgi:hypothetical protein